MTLKNSKVCCFSDLHLGVHQNSSQWHDIAIEFGKWLKKKLKEQELLIERLNRDDLRQIIYQNRITPLINGNKND